MEWKCGDAALFLSRVTAIAGRDQCCLNGDAADTFAATITLSVHAGRWTTEELVAHLKQHRRFSVSGPPEKGGVLLEIIIDDLKAVANTGETRRWISLAR